MSASFKWRIASTSALIRDIQKNARELRKSRLVLNKRKETLDHSFGQLQNAIKSSTKYDIKPVKLKEAHPRIRYPQRKQKEKIQEISGIIRYEIIKILNEVDDLVLLLKRIIIDADTLLYRESKRLDEFHQAAKKLKGPALAKEIMFRLSILKEEIKTTARRLYESAQAPSLLRKPFQRKKMPPLSLKVIQLSEESELLGKTLKRLKVKNIDAIIKNAEKGLSDIRKIELAGASLFPESRSFLRYIQRKNTLLDPATRARVEKRLADSELYLEKTQKQIISSAEKLFKEIIIIKKIE